MLYSQSTKNMIQGISQQPEVLRKPEQLAEQINGLSTESGGLQKRPPTILDSVLGKFDASNSYVHWINRDATERYALVLNGKIAIVISLDGTRRVVSNTDPNYLITDNPKRDFRAVTVADYTFIVNRKFSPYMRGDTSPAIAGQGAIVYVKSGQYGRTYSITVNGSTSAYTTPDGSKAPDVRSIDTTTIANNLIAAMQANNYMNTNFNFGNHNGAIHIVPKDHNVSPINSLTTHDGYAGQAMYGFTDSVQRFNLLPTQAPVGYRVKVAGDPNSGTGGYWLYYTSNGIWAECIAPSMLLGFQPATMPHSLVREANGTFTFKTNAWDDRASGDDDTNPMPSFIGKPINDIFFYKNRLGLLAGDNIILSEDDNYFNFWFIQSSDILDTDPIDLTTRTTSINNLLYAIPWDEQLYLFAQFGQYVLYTSGTLTPKTADILEVTGFNSEPDSRPVVAGKNIYFADARAKHTSIKEYYTVQQVSDVKNAQDITAHVPDLIPNGVYRLVANSSENILLAETAGDTRSLYIYKYLFLDEQRVQSSWSKWQFSANIIGVMFIEDMLYLLMQYDDNTMTLEHLTLTYNTKDFANEPYRAHIDGKVTTHATYDTDHQYSVIDASSALPMISKSDTELTLVTADGAVFNTTVGQLQSGKWYIQDYDLSGQDLYLGLSYLFKAEFSTLYIKQQQQNGMWKAKTNGRLQIMNVRVNYTDSGYFKGVVKTNRAVREYPMTSRKLGTDDNLLGAPATSEGTFRIPVKSLNTSATISVETDKPLPVALIGYFWEGNYIAKSREV